MGTTTLEKPAETAASAAQNDADLIVKFVVKMGRFGATADETAIYYDRELNTLSPQFVKLRRAGRIALNGLTRTTKQGCQAQVYVSSTDPTAKPEEEPDITYKEIYRKLGILSDGIKGGRRTNEEIMAVLNEVAERLKKRLNKNL